MARGELHTQSTEMAHDTAMQGTINQLENRRQRLMENRKFFKSGAIIFGVVTVGLTAAGFAFPFLFDHAITFGLLSAAEAGIAGVYRVKQDNTEKQLNVMTYNRRGLTPKLA